jgi:hypothetical protein
MKRKIWLLMVIIGLMACRPSETQLFPHQSPDPLPPDPAPQASDLTADQLLAKYAAARGGEQKLKGLTSLKMTGTWTSKGNSAPIITLVAPGRYLRRIAQGSEVIMANAVDGPMSWEINQKNSITKPTQMSVKDAARFRRLGDPQGALVDARAKGHKVEAVGKLPWNGSPVYKLKVVFKDGETSYFYLDSRSFLLTRVVGSQYVPQLSKNIGTEVTYQDFRDVGGVKFPFSEKGLAPEANFSQTVNWSKIEINQPLDSSAFKAPNS